MTDNEFSNISWFVKDLFLNYKFGYKERFLTTLHHLEKYIDSNLYDMLLSIYKDSLWSQPKCW